MKNKGTIKVMLVFFIFYLAAATHFQKLCSPFADHVKLAADEEFVYYNIETVFTNAVKKLGEGSYGEVKQAIWVDGSAVAVKRIRFDTYDSDAIEALDNELEALVALNKYTFIPKFIGCTITLTKMYLVLELVNGKTLEESNFSHKLKRGPAQDAMSYFIKLFEPIWLMRKEGLVHNDIKPSNIMFDEDKNAIYLIDFGTANKVSYPRRLVKGTPYYVSLNRLTKGKYTVRDDLFSMVISLAELYSAIGNVYSICLNRSGSEATLPEFLQNRVFDAECQQAIERNLKNIFGAKGYLGKYEIPQDPTQMNLTTLFTRIVADASYQPSINEVMEIIYKNAKAYGVERSPESSYLRPLEVKEESFAKKASQLTIDSQNERAAQLSRPSNQIQQTGIMPNANYLQENKRQIFMKAGEQLLQPSNSQQQNSQLYEVGYSPSKNPKGMLPDQQQPIMIAREGRPHIDQKDIQRRPIGSSVFVQAVQNGILGNNPSNMNIPRFPGKFVRLLI